ncbi:MAG TPA: pentapeptide repeat-containing protein [Gaiellaceae bacterium]
MSKPPREPYQPDLDDGSEPLTELGDLVDARVVDADWSNERATRLSLQRVELRHVRMTGIELAESSLQDVTFDECRIDLAGVRFARLERVVFRDCRMTECDLYGTTMKDVLFERCELREATWSEAKLERVEVRGCDLAGIRGAESLRGVRMPWPDVVANAGVFAVALGVDIVE